MDSKDFLRKLASINFKSDSSADVTYIKNKSLSMGIYVWIFCPRVKAYHFHF